MLIKGWVTAEVEHDGWKPSRSLLAADCCGCKQLLVAMSQFERVIGAITRIIRAV